MHPTRPLGGLVAIPTSPNAADHLPKVRRKAARPAHSARLRWRAEPVVLQKRTFSNSSTRVRCWPIQRPPSLSARGSTNTTHAVGLNRSYNRVRSDNANASPSSRWKITRPVLVRSATYAALIAPSAVAAMRTVGSVGRMTEKGRQRQFDPAPATVQPVAESTGHQIVEIPCPLAQ